ncbi:MAG: RHS repeat protein [Bdellovibrionales bacterium]|nr:RHS repeat protein [Bdellovibrionales bacterium]
MKLFLLCISILIALPSLATVNMRNGSYAEKWIDVISPGTGYDLRIQRYYSSRSLFIGLFGFGWCSSLETKIEHTSDGTITLSECGGGIEVSYYPKNFDPKSANQTVDKIISYYKKNNRKLSSAYLKKLRTQLVSDTKQRFEIANKLHLVSSKSLKMKKDTYVSKSRGLEEIRFNGRLYVRVNFDGTVEKYNLRGQLSQMVDKVGNWIKLNYKNDRIAFIVDNKGRRLNFAYARSGKLNRIYDGRSLEVKYSFEGENLTQVTNAWGNTYTYKYDRQHNMTQVIFPKKNGKPQSLKISYDIANDWVRSYTDRLGCSQKFEFIMDQKNPKNHYWSNVSTTCDNKNFSVGHFEYWYKNYQHSKLKFLHRAMNRQNDNVKDTYFHSYLGKPISIHENLNYTGYAYKPSGLTHKKELKAYSDKRELLDWNRILYRYNKQIRKMSETVTELLNNKGKVMMTTKTAFEYDKKRLLKRAKQSSGIYIDVNYNTSGKISSLTDHKKTKISFSYDNVNEKPVKIKHSSLGEVTIDYDTSGEVDKVSSRKGRNIASSVIQELIQFVQLLGPGAEEEIKL